MVETTYENEGTLIRSGCFFEFKRSGLQASLAALSLEFATGGERRLLSFELDDVGSRLDMDGWHLRFVEGRLAVTLDIALPAIGQYSVLSLGIESDSPGPVHLHSLNLKLDFSLREGVVTGSDRLSWFRNGWQSWSFAGAVDMDAADIPSPRLPLIYGMKEDPVVPRREAWAVSDMVAVAKIGDEGVLAGAADQRYFQRIRFQPETKGFSFTLVTDLDSAPLPPYSRLEVGGWHLEGERTATILLKWWAGRVAEEGRSRIPASTFRTFPLEHRGLPGDEEESASHGESAAGLQPDAGRAARERVFGWCSWYERQGRINAKYIRDTLRIISNRPELEPVDVILIDDGYQSAVGDWLETSPRFGGNLEQLAADISATGRTPGIWLTPFIAEAKSRLLAEHPGWFLHRGRGLLRGGWNPHWRSSFFALDLTHPEVQEWLVKLFGKLRSWGFRFFKLDYLYPAALRAQRHASGVGRFQALREGLALVREAAGADARILGCGCPLAPAAGMVDAMRVSTDVEFSWESPAWLASATGDREIKGIYPAARNTLGRLPFARFFWQVDPDCLLVRRRHSRLKEGEQELFNTLAATAGDVIMIGDDLTRWGERDFQDFSRIAGLVPERSMPLYTSDLVHPAWVQTRKGSSDRVVAFNLGDYKEMISLAKERLGHSVIVEAVTPLSGEAEVQVDDERVSFCRVEAHTRSIADLVLSRLPPDEWDMLTTEGEDESGLV